MTEREKLIWSHDLGEKFQCLLADLNVWSQTILGGDGACGPEVILPQLESGLDAIYIQPLVPRNYGTALICLLDAARRAGIGPVELLEAGSLAIEQMKRDHEDATQETLAFTLQS